MQAQAQAKKPNIIMIMGDDVGTWNFEPGPPPSGNHSFR